MKLTQKIAEWYSGKIITIGDYEFHFSVSKLNINGINKVTSLSVDCYIDGDWESDFSSTYSTGDVIENEVWAMPV